MAFCCWGVAPQEHEEGVIAKRRCRDLIPLLFFLAFCGGMVYVCIEAFKQGDPRRIYYGIDSYGNVCGARNDWNGGSGPDLTNRKRLYFLDPIELGRNPLNYQYAKAVCVDACPTAADVCSVSAVPCLSADQYRCPYYAVVEPPINGTLTGVTDAWSTDYFTQLYTTTATCSGLAAGLPVGVSAAFQAAAPLGATACSWVYQAQSQVPSEGPCYAVWAESVEFMHRCLPKFPPGLASQCVDATLGTLTSASLNNSRDRLQRYITDIGRGLYIISAAGLGGGLVLSILWLLFLRYFAGVVAWLTVLAANLLFVGCTILSYQKAGLLTNWGSMGAYLSSELDGLGQAGQSAAEVDRQQWAYVAYTLSALAGLLLLLTLLFISRIKVAVATLKVASQTVVHVPGVFFFPLFPFIAAAGFTAYWSVVAAYLYSTGTITPHYRAAPAPVSAPFTLMSIDGAGANGSFALAQAAATEPTFTDVSCANNPNCYYSLDWNTQQKYLFIYHLFSLLWVYQFIIGFTQVSIAGAVAHFYWAGGDSSKMPRLPLLHSVRNALTYHLGSIAFGSFIIAVCQFVRLAFEFLAARFRQLQEQCKAVWLVVWLTRIFLWLLEAILKFIKRNAYILVASKGTSYCASASRAAVLIVSNALRVAAVNTVGDFLIFLGKLAVGAGAGFCALLLSNAQMFADPVAYPDTYLSSPILPVAVSVGAAYTIATLFASVYEMGVDTVLLSFCEDCESHNGHPRYAPDLLMEALGVAHEAGGKGKAAEGSAFIVATSGGGGPKAPAAPARAGGDWTIGSV